MPVGLGGMGLFPGGRESDFLFDVDFRTFTPGGMSAAAFLSASGLNFARALSAKGFSETVQTSDQAVVTSGLTANVARIGQWGPTSATRGLVIEESRLNGWLNCRSLASAGGGTAPTAGNFTAPDGTTLTLNRLEIASAGYSVYGNVSGAFSLWTRSGLASGTSSSQIACGDGSGNSRASGQTVDQTWRRVQTIASATGTQSNIVVDGRDWHTLSSFTTSPNGLVAGARDAVVDLIQVEYFNSSTNGQSTEAILTDGTGPNTRAGEKLTHPDAAALFDAGWLCMYAKIIPKIDWNRMRLSSAGSGRLITFDANNYVEYAEATGNWQFVSAGSSLGTIATVHWSQFDVVECFAQIKVGQNARMQMRVNGGSVQDTQIGVVPSFSVPATADLFCNGTADQFTAWIQHVSFYKAGKRPAWANA